MIFVDTCYLIALINTKARKHQEAIKLLEIIEDESTLINSTTLLEMMNNLNKKRYEAVREETIELLHNMDHIDFISEKDFQEAYELWKYYNHSVNFSDCTIVKTMEKYNVNNILSFDGDFDKIKGINRIYL